VKQETNVYKKGFGVGPNNHSKRDLIPVEKITLMSGKFFLNKGN
jgi:hypothetical protein